MKSSGRLFLLDTNILIYLLKGVPESVARKIDRLKPEDRLGMSWVTWAELLLGALRSTRSEQVRKQLEGIQQVIPVLLPESPLICSYHAEHAARLRAAGTPIGGNDLWIAAHALALGATLVTHNVKEFRRIRGLSLDDWVH
ncbi:MAG: type II toxin-antitoxin system VapC family toxin [Burkholderiales bacterium]